ncbi:hypothetical protein POVWA2_038170 [Plasmodium ovale wallikeri]|uniref:Uncharacterized protein n=2 Tax=Plasmodium ovale TaxID=36330 RepID=A0A1A8Z720_PLAOA|nr:hypothetical protein POVWA2_038170 [Plasmodium ovale wallikeri]
MFPYLTGTAIFAPFYWPLNDLHHPFVHISIPLYKLEPTTNFMKNIYCFFSFCNLFVSSSNKRKTFYNLKVKKVSNVTKSKLYNTDDHYSRLEKSRNNEYEDILNEIIYEYAEEERKKKKKTERGEHNGEGEEDNEKDKTHRREISNVPGSTIGKNFPDDSSTTEEQRDFFQKDEIERIKKFKENNIVNIFNLNYDILNMLLKKELKEIEGNDKTDGHYNQMSLFLETQMNGKRKEDNLCIEDSVGRYFLNIDNRIIETISERELHNLRNQIHKSSIYLKYHYLKSYKSAIHNLKGLKQKKTEQINKHVELVHEDEAEGETNDGKNCEENRDENRGDNPYASASAESGNNGYGGRNRTDESDNLSQANGKVKMNYRHNYTLGNSNAPPCVNGLGKDNTSISYLEKNDGNLENLEKIDPELSLKRIKEIIDVNQRLTQLQKNFDDLKNFNIFQVLNNNRFLNSLKVHNFEFHSYNCSLVNKSMKKFVRKIQQEGDSNGSNIDSDSGNPRVSDNELAERAELDYAYVCTPKTSDLNFLKNQNKSIVINLSNKYENENNDLDTVSELNVDTDKGILILSANEKNLNVHVRNICDKVSYLTQSLSIYPQIHFSREQFSRNVQILKRIILIMLFYFNIKNMYVICLDNTSAKYFYDFMKNCHNLLKNFYKTTEQEEPLFVNLNEMKFSHLFNKNFVPLFTVESIFKNYVFMMNKEEKFYDISFFKRSCLFMFLDEHVHKQNHVISSSVQHFFYYKKFLYPFIYNIDSKYSLKTLKSFNEILLYVTSWIDIFHTGEGENYDSKDDDCLQEGYADMGTSDQNEEEETRSEEEEEFILKAQNEEVGEENDDHGHYYEQDERTCEGSYGKDMYSDKRNEGNWEDGMH